MKTIHHRKFLEENKLKMADFPEPIRQKAAIFNNLHKRLNTSEGDCRQQLQLTLTDLDEELHSELMDELEDRLENNEEPDNSAATPQSSKKDEDILEKLWKMKRTHSLRRSFLQSMGLTLPLAQKVITIGDFRLVRTSVFFYTYRLEKQ